MTANSTKSNLGIKLVILAIFVGGVIAFYALGGDQWLSLEALKGQRDKLLLYTESHYVLMLIASILIYITSTALSLPGGAVLSLTIGLMFGRWVGTAVIILSATIGATLVFLAARYLFAAAARRRLGGHTKKIIEGFHENAFSYMLFLRLVPFPFWLVNLAPAFTSISVRTYVIATAIGILPGSFVFANLGQSLGRIDSVDELLSKEILLALVLLGLFALMPIVIKKIRAKKVGAPKHIG